MLAVRCFANPVGVGSWAYLTYPCQSLVENYIQPLYLGI